MNPHPTRERLQQWLAGRRGKGIPVGKKVLIVLDQFEQWLHAQASRGHQPPDSATELI